MGVAWAGAQGGSYGQLPLWFLAGHGPGLIGSGYLYDYRPSWVPRGARGSALAAALGTLALWRLPTTTWPLLFFMLGLSTSLGMIAWGRWYATGVPLEWLGRAFALPAALIALLDWLYSLAVRSFPPEPILLATLLPAGLSLWAATQMNEVSAQPPRIPPSLPAPERRQLALSYGLFILFIYLVAGLSYQHLFVAPLTPFADEIWRRLPYLVGVVMAGLLADRRHLQVVARLGAALLALAFLLGAWGEVAAAQHLSIGLNGMAFGLLEPVTWLLLASLATPKTAGRWFGWGLNLNVLTILAGALLTLPLSGLSPERLGLIAASVIMGAVLSLQMISDPLRERRHAEPAEAELPPTADPLPLTLSGQLSVADLLGASFGEVLSKRELEVGRLTLLGLSTREVAAELYLSEHTVKTHLRNIYRKTETTNRNDLYRRLVEPGPR